jgi:ribosomal protein L19E
MTEKELKAKEKLENTVYRSIYLRIKNNETGEVEFVPLYSWTEKKK